MAGTASGRFLCFTPGPQLRVKTREKLILAYATEQNPQDCQAPHSQFCGTRNGEDAIGVGESIDGVAEELGLGLGLGVGGGEEEG